MIVMMFGDRYDIDVGAVGVVWVILATSPGYLDYMLVGC